MVLPLGRRPCCKEQARRLRRWAWRNALTPSGSPRILRALDRPTQVLRGGVRPWEGGRWNRSCSLIHSKMGDLTGTKARRRPIGAGVPPEPAVRPMLGWVLAGGGARGAYEVGVCGYLFDRIARDLGRPLPTDIVSGTSVGALHASALSAGIDDPTSALRYLAERWTSLELPDVVRVDRRRTFNMLRALFGRPPRHPTLDVAGGGVLDPRPLEKLLSSSIQFRRIQNHIAAGRLTALSLSATHVGSGSTTVFYQCADHMPPLAARSRTRYQRVTIGAGHAMASAAIPFVFPAVPIEGELFCDGSLRQHVPLSPAVRFGAEALIVINPKGPVTNGPALQSRERAFAGPVFLLGKTLNALTLDRVDGDIEQLERINRVLEAGTRRFGSDFVAHLNGALGAVGDLPLRTVSLLNLQASEDIGALAAAFVRSKRFRGRRGLLSRAFARLAEGEGQTEADLLSYLLFDSHFTSELIALGRRDAEKRREEILTFFTTLLERRAQADANNAEERSGHPAPPR